MRRDSLERTSERRRRFVAAPFASMQRANRVPRVGGAFTRIQVARMLGGEFTFKFLHCSRHVAVPEVEQAKQPMESHQTETAASLAPFGGEAGRQIALGFAECLARDVDGGGHPARKRKIRQQRQRPMRRTQTLLAPANEGGAEVMPPVVWLQRDRSFGSRCGVQMIASAIEHEPERRL